MENPGAHAVRVFIPRFSVKEVRGLHEKGRPEWLDLPYLSAFSTDGRFERIAVIRHYSLIRGPIYYRRVPSVPHESHHYDF
jgi:hypothetical protein